MSKDTFDCDHFLSLSNGELIDYTEPFVTTQADKVPCSVYETLANKLDELSDTHVVYALEICMRIAPQEFASQAVEFLSHSDPSVNCTAYRVIESLPPEFVSSALVKRIAETPVVDLITSHVRTGERVKIGTNEEVVRELLDKFKGELSSGSD